MSLEPLQENLWYKKVLSDIRTTDRQKSDMEHNFKPAMRDAYDEIIKQEAREGAELLKLGASYKLQGSTVLISVDEDTFEISKDLLRDELGIDQYNLLINHGEEAKVEPEEEIPSQDEPEQTFTSPDGNKIPSSIAPFYVMQQAINQAMNIYTGKPVDMNYPAVPQTKVKSKSLSEILKNISELQQQVINIEEEKAKAVNASALGSQEDKEKISDLSDRLDEKQKELNEALTKIEELNAVISEKDGRINELSQAISQRKESLKQVCDRLEAAEAEINDRDGKINNLQNIINADRNASDTFNKKIAELKSQVEEKDEALKAADKLVTEKTDELENEKRRFNDREHSYDNEKRSASDREAGLRREIKEKDEKIKALTEDKDRLSTEHNDALSQKDKVIAEKDKEVNGLRGRISNLENRINQLNSSQVSKEDKDKIDGYDDLKRQNDKQQSRVSELQRQLKDKDREIGNKDRAISDIKKDLSDSRSENERLSYENKDLSEKAYGDSLTGLLNEQALNRDLDDKDYDGLVIARIGICGMKEINRDSYKNGDTVISYVADKLKKTFDRENIYRMMGDQFVVIGNNKSDIREKMEDVDKDFQNDNVHVAYGIAEKDKEHGQNIHKLYGMATSRMSTMRDDIYKEMNEPEEEYTEEEREESSYEPEKSSKDDSKLVEDESFSNSLMESIDDDER